MGNRMAVSTREKIRLALTPIDAINWLRVEKQAAIDPNEWAFLLSGHIGEAYYTMGLIEAFRKVHNNDPVCVVIPEKYICIAQMFPAVSRTVTLNALPKPFTNSIMSLRGFRKGMQTLKMKNVMEIGTSEAYYDLIKKSSNTRFFNTVEIKNNTVVKKTINKEFSQLLKDEINWYKFVINAGYNNIPKIKSYHPLTMEYIRGNQPYLMKEVTTNQRQKILKSIFVALEKLHAIGTTRTNQSISNSMYIAKTRDRIQKVSKLIPNKSASHYIINGDKVPNLLNPRYSGRIAEIVGKMKKQSEYNVIHGDPTFSNTIIEENTDRVVFIDPRGYFGTMKICGDRLYDYAKLYYSVVGNYDQFNSKEFKTKMDRNEVEISIKSSGWEHLSKTFERTFGEEMREIKILHALIWLSLSGYVIDDVDSVQGAYFNGLWLFNSVWNDYA